MKPLNKYQNLFQNIRGFNKYNFTMGEQDKLNSLKKNLKNYNEFIQCFKNFYAVIKIQNSLAPVPPIDINSIKVITL